MDSVRIAQTVGITAAGFCGGKVFSSHFDRYIELE